jgi:hypothetical protein
LLGAAILVAILLGSLVAPSNGTGPAPHVAPVLPGTSSSAPTERDGSSVVPLNPAPRTLGLGPRPQVTGGWASVCSSCSPGALSNASMTYDPATGDVVLFGGENAAGVPQGATWTFSGGTWTEVCASCGPAARFGASMGYFTSSAYPAYDGVILFGGRSGTGFLNDTWVFASGAWSLVCAACGPSPRMGAAMAWDVPDHQLVLAGGCGTTCPLNDTWGFSVYTGGATSWLELCRLCAFVPRTNASIAWDSIDGYLLLFGGSGPTHDRNDALAFDGTTNNWTTICPSCSPTARAGAAASWDSADGFVLMFGGFNSSTGSAQDADSWDFTDNAWYALALSASPTAREGAAISDDPSAGEVVIYGGSGSAGGAMADSWAFHYGMTVSIPTATPAQIENGQTVTFTTSVSGGTGPNTITWIGLPTGCSSSNNLVLSCTPSGVSTNATFQVQALGVDSNNAAVLTPPFPYTVLANPSPPFVLSSAPSAGIDSGQTVTFWTLASGGTGVYTFTWAGLPSGCAPANLRVLPCTPTGITTNQSFGVSVSIMDSDGVTAGSGPLTFQVDSDPIEGTVLENRTTVESGQSITFSTSATGGSGTYSFHWSGLPAGCPLLTTASLSCTVGAYPRNTTIMVGASVLDSNHFTAWGTNISLSIIAGPAVTTPLATPTSIDTGQSVSFQVSAIEGVGGYTFDWVGLPPGCSSANAPSVSCTPSRVFANTTYDVSVDVTDANGEVIDGNSLIFQINADPTLSRVVSSPASVDSGQAVVFEVSAHQGSGVYTYLWTGLPTGCVSVNAPTWVCVPKGVPSNTTFEVNVTVTDSDSFSVQSLPLSLQVFGQLTASLPVATPPAVDAGQELVLQVVATLGDGGYSFRWAGLPTGCPTENAPRLVCRISATESNATYAVQVNVTDALGHGANSPILELSVDTAPTIVGITPVNSTVDLGGLLVVSVSAQDGSGSYSFAWGGAPPGCPATSTELLTCRPLALGKFPVGVTPLDGRGGEGAVVETNITVVAPLKIYAFEAAEDPAHPGQNASLTVSLQGGVAPFEFSYVGLPPGCASADLRVLPCVTQATGSFDISVEVEDASGLFANASLNLTVTLASTHYTLFGLPSTEAFLIIGGVAAGVIVLLLVVLPLLRGDLFRAEGEEGKGTQGPSEEEEEEETAAEGSEGAPAAEDEETDQAEPAPGSSDEGTTALPSENGPEMTGDEGSSASPPEEEAEVVPGSAAVPADSSAAEELSGELTPEPEPPAGEEAPPAEGPAAPGPESGTSTPADVPPTPEPAAPAAAAPASGESEARRCPLCGGRLDGGKCPTCEVDFDQLQIEGRTDTLKRPPKRSE